MDSESFRLVMEKKRAECCSCVPARYMLTFLVFCGLFVIYILRVNLSVSMVAMVNNSALSGSNSDDTCQHLAMENATAEKYQFEIDGEFVWEPYQQSLILGAFYYGYCLTQLPGGWISERIGGKWPFGIGICVTSIFTMLTPLAARFHIAFFIVTRIIKGLGEGVTYPAMYAMFSRWAPLKERSLLIAIASVGANLGTIVGMPSTAYLCEYGFDGGWPSVFYVCGALGCVWFVFWATIAASRPTRHPRITTHELIYLKQTMGPKKQRRPTPWKYILMSVPVWATTMARFASYWGLFTLIAELPNYLENVLHFTMDQNGFANAIIYTFQSIGMILGGYLADILRTRTSISINVNRKVFEAIGCFGPALCLLCVTFVDCNRSLVVGLITLGQFLYGFNAGGSIPAMVDLAPDFAGTVSGIVLTIASCAGFAAPLVAGKVVQSGVGIRAWDTVFYICSGIYVFGGVIFILFGSSEIQWWGKSEEDAMFDPAPSNAVGNQGPRTVIRGQRSSTLMTEKSSFSQSFQSDSLRQHVHDVPRHNASYDLGVIQSHENSQTKMMI